MDEGGADENTHDFQVVDLQQQERVERVLKQAPNPQSCASRVLRLRQCPARFASLLREVRVVLQEDHHRREGLRQSGCQSLYNNNTVLL